MSAPGRIPVTVLTGFLGSGKTTLLNRILTGNHGQRIAVIENEFGEIGVDQELVINAEEEIFELNNGCICCTVRGDLIRILDTLAARRERFDRVVLETTGLANPGPVAQTFFVDEAVRRSFALDGIVTLVDAAHFEQQLAHTSELQAQVAFADVVVINKTDLVSAERAARLEKRIRAVNAMARIVSAARDVRAGVELETVLRIGGFDMARALDLQPAFLEPEYPFEWVGLFDLEPGSASLRLAPGPDPAMSLAFVAADSADEEEPGRAAERVLQGFCGALPALLDREELEPELRAWTLRLRASGESQVRLNVPRKGSYWLFTQHLPAEFALRLLAASGVRLRPRLEKSFAAQHSHDARVSSFSLSSERPLDAQRFEDWIACVLREQGVRLFRLKGLIDLQGRSDRVVIQGVHMSLECSSLGPWANRPRRTQLVFIGRDLDRGALRAGFDSCLT